jgi:hypothetical protein
VEPQVVKGTGIEGVIGPQAPIRVIEIDAFVLVDDDLDVF